MIEPEQFRHTVTDWILKRSPDVATAFDNGDSVGIHTDEIDPLGVARLHLDIALDALHMACDVVADRGLAVTPAVLISLSDVIPSAATRLTDVAAIVPFLHLGRVPELRLIITERDLPLPAGRIPLPHFQYRGPVTAFVHEYGDQWNDARQDVWLLPTRHFENPPETSDERWCEIRRTVPNWVLKRSLVGATGAHGNDDLGFSTREICPTALARLHLSIAFRSFDVACDAVRDNALATVPVLAIQLSGASSQASAPNDIKDVASLEQVLDDSTPPELMLHADRHIAEIKTGVHLINFKHTSQPATAYLQLRRDGLGDSWQWFYVLPSD